jgi:hypothetical protein
MGTTALEGLGLLSAAQDTVVLPVEGYGSVGVQILGTYSGTVTFECSLNALDWVTWNVVAVNGSSAITSTSSTGLWVGSAAGLVVIRLRMSAYTSGLAQARLLAAAQSAAAGGGGGGGGGGTVQIQGDDGATKATVFDYTSSNPMAVRLVDSSGAGYTASGAPASSTSALTNVAATASSVTLLASNASRLAFDIYNDDTGTLLLKFGTTASTTSYTKQLLAQDYFGTHQLGVNYTGRIDGIWLTPGSGAARVTELT